MADHPAPPRIGAGALALTMLRDGGVVGGHPVEPWSGPQGDVGNAAAHCWSLLVLVALATPLSLEVGEAGFGGRG